MKTANSGKVDDEGDLTDRERCLPYPEIQSRQPIEHEGHGLTFTGDCKVEELPPQVQRTFRQISGCQDHNGLFDES